jgi:N-ethylmaleimide reductase
MTSDPLFESYDLGTLALPNRLVMAPMTRTRAGLDGTPGPTMAEYYAQRATAGLIIAEATTPNAAGQTYPRIPAMFTPAHVEGWRRVTSRVGAAGGRMYLQLQHGGRIGHPDTSGMRPLAPSAVPLPGTVHTPTGHQTPPVPRVLTESEIRSTIDDFANAAGRAIDAGFEGVEVHAANGYLLHQFLAASTNDRTDGYGGDLDGRMRAVVETVGAVSGAIGPGRVGLRIAPGFVGNGIEEGDTAALYGALIPRLAEAGITYLHVVFADPDDAVFQRIRCDWPGTLIANPVLGWPDLPADGGKAAAERLLDAGADLVSLGRAFLANPDLVTRLRLSAPLNPVRTEYSMYVNGETGYLDYPTLAGS